MARNISDALVEVVRDVMVLGDDVHVRGQNQKEIRAYNVKIERPMERVLMVPGRNNNIFAQVAETIWVLAGRDDMGFLSLYLPRAVEFSDDGTTWRAAYGPRLRKWGAGVDQLKGVESRLKEDRYTKRAVMSIFDPALDYCETKDVPCNNWLHFLCRNGGLHLNVCVRANDAIWGFSGINVFEWSVLHEIMAASVGEPVGEMNWFAGSMHIYDRHYRVAEAIGSGDIPISLYDFGIPSIKIMSPLSDLDRQLDAVLDVEQSAREGVYVERSGEKVDPFFSTCATVLQIYNMFLSARGRDDIVELIVRLPASDLRVAVVEYLSRRWGRGFISDLPLTAGELAYFDDYFRSVARFRLMAA